MSFPHSPLPNLYQISGLTMSNKLKLIATTLAVTLYSLSLQNCDSKDDSIIITDDVLMLARVATGLESIACTDFASSRTIELPATGTQSVNWSEAKSLPNDTLKIIRLEILSDTGSVAKFTMTLRPLIGTPSEIQCMKGFGCNGAWELFDWIAPGQNFLDQTIFKFKVKPIDIERFTIENYNTDKALVVLVNPPI